MAAAISSSQVISSTSALAQKPWYGGIRVLNDPRRASLAPVRLDRYLAHIPCDCRSAPAARPVRFAVKAMKVKKGINKAVKGGAPNTGLSKLMEKKVRSLGSCGGKCGYLALQRLHLDPGWVDAQGNKGKGYGVYRFNKKYGANVDGYSPIWSPNEWSSKGDKYEPGVQGLAIWAVGFAALLATGGYAIYATSALS
eukprot:scaffold7855_cov444-Prasinococcus_capsulatus_cf.AAC.2